MGEGQCSHEQMRLSSKNCVSCKLPSLLQYLPSTALPSLPPLPHHHVMTRQKGRHQDTALGPPVKPLVSVIYPLCTILLQQQEADGCIFNWNP